MSNRDDTTKLSEDFSVSYVGFSLLINKQGLKWDDVVKGHAENSVYLFAFAIVTSLYGSPPVNLVILEGRSNTKMISIINNCDVIRTVQFARYLFLTT